MRTMLIVKINPSFCRSQKSSKTVIRIAFSHSELKNANKTLCIPIVGGSSRPAHREHKTFLQEQLTSLLGSELLALIAVPDTAKHFKGHCLHRVGDQIRTHVVVKGHPQNRASSFVQSEAASYARAIGEAHLQDIRENNLFALDLLWHAQQVRSHLTRFPRIDIFSAFAPSRDAILAHHAFDAVFPSCKHHRKLAMAHLILFFVQLLNAHSQLLIHLRTLWLHIQATASDAQGTGKVAVIDRTIGSTDLASQFHLLMCT